MGIVGSKEKDTTASVVTASPQSQSLPQEQHRFEDIALGQTVDPLESHAVAASPTIVTQPSPRERSSGQTRKLFGSEPLVPSKQLSLGDLIVLAGDIGKTGFHKLIDDGHHELASLLMPYIEIFTGDNLLLEFTFEGLCAKLKTQGIDPQRPHHLGLHGVQAEGSEQPET